MQQLVSRDSGMGRVRRQMGRRRGSGEVDRREDNEIATQKKKLFLAMPY
jgi:hypothetical protein